MHNTQKIGNVEAWLRKTAPGRKHPTREWSNGNNNSRAPVHPGTVQQQWNSYTVKAPGFGKGKGIQKRRI